MENREKFHTTLFWIFCFVVFAKIGWYDIRVYMAPDDRRQFMTVAFAVWIIAHGLVWLPVAVPMVRAFNLPAVIWGVLITPYFILGIIDGNLNSYFIRDIVRYALPFGYILFFSVIVRNVSLRNIMTALIVSLSVWIVLRTIIHYVIAERIIRFGIQWEVFLPALLIPFSCYLRGWRQIGVVAFLVAVIAILALGQTRAILLGTVTVAGVCGIVAVFGVLRGSKSALTLGLVSTVAAFACLAPMLLTVVGGHRLNAITTISEVAGSINSVAPLTESKLDDSLTPADAAHNEWEHAIANRGLSLDTRITEANYFLALAGENVSSLIFGTGAGTYRSVTTRSGFERIVRAPHVTYAMIFYRHGYVFGLLLILFLLFYGVPQNIRSLSGPTEERTIALALLSYRAAIALIALLHQGIIDDPIFFLSIAAAAGWRPSPGNKLVS